MANAPTLQLVRERKISELVPREQASKRWEASGVLAKNGQFLVVFDDRTEIARLAESLQPHAENGLFGMARQVYGYEGIAYNSAKQRYYLLVEAHKHSKNGFRAVIVEYDDDFKYLKDRPVEFTFKSDNKGFEAIAHVQREGEDYLLALCEGNKCKCGKQGRTPGGGRVHVFEKKRKQWRHSRVLALPPTLPFIDYSGMSLDHGRVAIVSQVNSMLWVGEFDEAAWGWRDDGQLYQFPRTAEGAVRYGNVEGVSWLSPTCIVTVSDRRKKDQPDENLAETDQSVHVFEIPSVG